MRLAWILLPALVAGILTAQEPKFEVASIKPHGTGNGPLNVVELNLVRGMARGVQGGRFHVTGAPLQMLIELAYGVKDFQIVSAPAWVNSFGYDITAKAEGNANFEQIRPMLRSLLADRFKLTLRRESREFPVFELTVAKGGPKIVAAADGSCVTPDPKAARLPFGSKVCGGVRSGVGRIEGFGITMPKLVELLADQVGRTVIDKTGFTARFNFEVEFTPDDAPSGPSIFTALQEQLGLRLVSTKGPIEVLVVEHVERPSEN